MTKIKLAWAVAVLCAAPVVANAAFEPPLSGYAAPCATVSYPTGFADAGVTISGMDLTGIGACHGQPERLTASGSMMLIFAPTEEIAIYLWPPGPWLLATSATAPFEINTANPGPYLLDFFVGPAVMDSLTLSAPLVALLTTPPVGVPEPWSIALLGFGAVAAMAGSRHSRPTRRRRP